MNVTHTTLPVESLQDPPQPLHVYWVDTAARHCAPDPASLLQSGVVLDVLESVTALVMRFEGHAPAGLVLVQQELALSPALCTWSLLGRGASMPAMPLIAMAETVTEEDMRACIDAGFVDQLPSYFALSSLHLLATRHLDPAGQPDVDGQEKITAIDSQSAMAHMQADAAFFATLLRAFFDELPARGKQLRDDWLRNPQQIKHQSHALKGLAPTLGLHHLAAVALRTETQAAQGQLLDASLLVQLEGEMQSTAFQILRWLQRHADVVEATP
jgi:HPt (histidine-containing phosphotransfer) domain-containing protein